MATSLIIFQILANSHLHLGLVCPNLYFFFAFALDILGFLFYYV